MTVAVPARQRPLMPALLLALLTMVLASLPEWELLPTPQGGVTLTEARLTGPDGNDETVRLPHSLHVPWAGPARAVYELTFTLDQPISGAQELYVPAARHSLSFSVNSRPGPEPAESPWLQPAQGMTTLVRLPHHLFVAGENRLRIELARREGSIPFHLSAVHLGPAGSLAQTPWFSMLLAGQGRIAAFVLHAVVLVGLLTLWTARRHDPVFRWLALLGSTTLAAALPEVGLVPAAAPVGPLVPLPTLLMGAFGLMALGLALAIAELPRPRWLVVATGAVPLVLLGWVLLQPERPLLPALVGAAIALLGHLAGALALILGFFRKRRWDMGLLAMPFLLVAWIGLRDVLVVTGLREAPFLLSSYVRPLTMLALVVLLMRRLASSLDSLDAANDVLRRRLAEQESELSSLHARERERAAQAVREEERQRLTRDLHDGLSGHLISIIALSERGSGEAAAVERAARAALDDLRLVINSLDIGDGDLPLALAGFRERLEPQLRRLGIGLDWSMDKLPGIDGVSPGNALSVLRILQEAVTNAIKHGPARSIAITGGAGPEGMVRIEIGNDGSGGPPATGGHGLDNMRRRARELGGTIALERDEDGARLILLLPRHLGEV